ncbi:MAG: hypothetical protein WD604_10345 [Balneolaceae bacterium]
MQENDKYVFTIYGVLDVHADTQWVRVMPIGEALIPTDPDPNGTVVRLARESNGETIALNDSLFRFGGDSYVWNYWTTESLQPNESYNITAETPGGKQSLSIVTLPSALSVPEVEYSEEYESIMVSGHTEEQLVLVETRYLVQAVTEMGCAPEREVVISHQEEVTNMSGQYHLSTENWSVIAKELDVNAFNFIVNRRELIIVSAGEDWIGLSDLTEEEIFLPDKLSNVENGTGVVAGIASRKILITPRQEPCQK